MIPAFLIRLWGLHWGDEQQTRKKHLPPASRGPAPSRRFSVWLAAAAPWSHSGRMGGCIKRQSIVTGCERELGRTLRSTCFRPPAGMTVNQRFCCTAHHTHLCTGHTGSSRSRCQVWTRSVGPSLSPGMYRCHFELVPLKPAAGD